MYVCSSFLKNIIEANSIHPIQDVPNFETQQHPMELLIKLACGDVVTSCRDDHIKSH